MQPFDLLGPLPTERSTTVLQASAGTGKTFALAGLVTRYLAEGVATLDQMLLITFSRSASQELRERVRRQIADAVAAFDDPSTVGQNQLVKWLINTPDDERARREQRLRDALAGFDAATIATTHQFCQLVLRSLGVAGDTGSNVTLLESLADLTTEIVDDLYLARFGQQRDDPLLHYGPALELARAVVGNPAAELRPRDAEPGSEAAARLDFAKDVLAELETRKRRLGVLGYDDLLSRLAGALDCDDSPARRRMHQRWPIVMVDEFQDTDQVQWQVIDRAFGGRSTVILIGDPKQAIYAFRGGDIVTYLEAAKTAGERKTLATNWRSDSALLTRLQVLLGGAQLGDVSARRDWATSSSGDRATVEDAAMSGASRVSGPVSRSQSDRSLRLQIVSFEPGSFVAHPAIPGIGRIAENNAGVLVVHAFDSPAREVAETWKLPADECAPVRLPVEQRVYRHDPETGQWEAGRVMAQSDSGYAVRFPDSEYDRIIPADQLRVRWEKPITSPAEVLVAGAVESPYYRDARIPMLHALIDQRQACASFTAVLSSAVEIYSHQIDTALTVLSDPVQRYLLADEVGLGKTIEAGLIIRQQLIDNPKARIAVLTPEMLRRQWQDELRTKFFVDDFPKAIIKISSHDAPDKWADYLGYDLVVVDEVHTLTRSGGADAPPYPQLAALSHSVDRLLLLSATPSTARADRQLALLNLLDPDVYRWDDLPAFTERFAQHRELANAMDSLSADFESLLPISIAEIRELLPHDPRFESLSLDTLAFLDDESFLRSEDDRPALGVTLDTLRAHLAETYRLHRRTIRHRRTRVIEDVNEDLLPFEVTGRRPPTALTRPAPATVDALLDWQQQVAAWVLDHVNEDDKMNAAFTAYGDVLAVLSSRVDGQSDDFAQAVQFRLTGDERAAQRSGLSAAECEMLRVADVLPFEAETLMVTSEPDHTLDAELSAVITKHQRTVVFCGSGQLPGLLADSLRGRIKIPVFEHTSAVAAEQIDSDLRQWRATGGVLIADATAEDGVNLQQADAAVHLRLPWSPNRLEQRIGRIDRYAGAFGQVTQPAKHFIVSLGDTAESFPAAWTDLSVHAFEAWTTSMSAIQDRLDELQTELWATAVRSGPQRMRDACADVTVAVADERKQIQVMDALDAVADSSLGEKIAVRLGTSETRWRAYERDTRRYVAPDSGGIRFTVTEPGSAVEFGADTNRKPLISPLLLTNQFGQLPAGSMRGVFNRSTALRNPGLRLFRSGNPFISGLHKVITVDERGQASAMLRRLSTQDPVSYFGFDLLAEADLTRAVECLRGEGELALRRYADALFPPTLARMWLRPAGDEFVREPKLLEWLNCDYDKRRDKNLAGNMDILADIFGGFDRFGEEVRAAELTAVSLFGNEAVLRGRADRAQAEAQQLLTIYRSQAEARQAAGRLITDAESYLLDVEIRAAVVDALAHPAIRVMAATCVIGGRWTSG